MSNLLTRWIFKYVFCSEILLQVLNIVLLNIKSKHNPVFNLAYFAIHTGLAQVVPQKIFFTDFDTFFVCGQSHFECHKSAVGYGIVGKRYKKANSFISTRYLGSDTSRCF